MIKGGNIRLSQVVVSIVYMRKNGILISDLNDVLIWIRENYSSVIIECHKFISVKENFDTISPSGRFMLVVFAALAEMERDYILDRQSEGIAIAKAEGRFNGRPLKKLDDFENTYRSWKNNNISAAKASKKLGIARSTFYRRVKEYDGSEIVDFG